MKKVYILLIMLMFCWRAQGQVTLLFPDDGEELTDIAVAFKAKITSAGPHYLYVSRNRNFTGEVIRRPAQTGKGEITYNIQYFLTYQGKVKPNDRFVLAPGTWYWRVSGDGGASFSETRRLVVNDHKPLTPPEWDISPERPMFHMRLRSQVVDNAPNGDIGAALRKIIPDELKPYVVLDIGHSFSFLPKERSLYEYSKIFDDLGYKYFYDMGSHAWLGRIASLGEMEKVFRDLNHCVGASTPEIFYYIFNSEADRSMMDGALELCRKYGKKFLMADMNWKWAKWQHFNTVYYDIFKARNYADYYIPQFKTTDPWGTYTNINSLIGMKLTGMVSDIGIWSDWWTWEKMGQVNTVALKDFLDGGHGTENNKLYPFIQNIKNYIYGITFGSTTFALEANLQWHWLTADPNDHYYRYLQPFIQAVIREKLIPDESVVRNSYKVMVDTEFQSTNVGSTPSITYMPGNIWGDFLRSTYGISDVPAYNEVIPHKSAGQIIQAAYAEMIPNTDRYPCGIPFLPKPGVPAPVVNGQRLNVVKISDLNTQQKVNQRLNPHYPDRNNEAFAVKIDRSIFVFNTHENHDIRQSYSVDINHAGIQSLSGDIDLMSYVVGRCRDDGRSVFFQVNGYVKNPGLNGGKYTLPNYPSILRFRCKARPVLTTDEPGAIVREQWNSQNKTLTIEVNHTTAGAVNFTLSAGSAQAAAIPGVIQAEHYDDQSGTQTENTTDTGGGQAVAYIENGDFNEYNVLVAQAGKYEFGFRVASGTQGGRINVYANQQLVGHVDVAGTNGWQNWVTVRKNLALSSGAQKLRLVYIGGNGYLFNVNYMDIKLKQAVAPVKIEAENYTAHFGTLQEPTTDVGGGYNLSFIDHRDYSTYEVDVAAAGNYIMDFRVASNTAGGTIQVYTNEQLLGNVRVNNTGGWQNWVTVSTALTLPQGRQSIRLAYTGGGGSLFNLNYLVIKPQGSSRLDLRPKASLSLYPNPAKEQISIKGWEEGMSWELFDNYSKRLNSGGSPNVDLSGLPNGQYIILTSDGQALKLIKQNKE